MRQTINYYHLSLLGSYESLTQASEKVRLAPHQCPLVAFFLLVGLPVPLDGQMAY